MVTHPTPEMAKTMFDKAASSLQEDERRIIHSDCGDPYRWPGWNEREKTHGLVRSMSEKLVPPIMLPVKDSLGALKIICSTAAHGRVLASAILWIVFTVICAGVMKKNKNVPWRFGPFSRPNTFGIGRVISPSKRPHPRSCKSRLFYGTCCCHSLKMTVGEWYFLASNGGEAA